MAAWIRPLPSRSDPGRATGSTTGYAPLPGCANPDVACAHMGTVHVPDEGKPYGRGACTAADPDKCPCTVYTPGEEVPHAA